MAAMTLLDFDVVDGAGNDAAVEVTATMRPVLDVVDVVAVEMRAMTR